MRPATRRAVLAAAATAVLSGCERSLAGRPVFQDIRFTAQPPIRIDVAEIVIQDRFEPSFKEPNVEHIFPVTPARAAANWARDRLEATDRASPRRLRVVITDASVRETLLPKTGGVRGAFTTDQAEKYEGTIEMTVELLGERGFPEASVSGRALRTQTLPEGVTPNQREQAWHDFTRALVADLDREMEPRLRATFANYIRG